MRGNTARHKLQTLSIYSLLGLLICFNGCFENVRQSKPNYARSPKKAGPNSLPSCEPNIEWHIHLPKSNSPNDPFKKPPIFIQDVKAETRQGEIFITLTTDKIWDRWLDHETLDGFKFGTVLLEMFIDRDFLEPWGIPSAWVRENDPSIKREPEILIRVELGFSVSERSGGPPTIKTGHVKIDTSKLLILEKVARFSLKQKNQGKWENVYPDFKKYGAGFSFRSLTTSNGNLISVRVPYGFIKLDPRGSVLAYFKSWHGSKSIRSPWKCLNISS